MSNQLITDHVDLLLEFALVVRTQDAKALDRNRQMFHTNLQKWLAFFQDLLPNRLLYLIYRKSCSEMFEEESDIAKNVVLYSVVPSQPWISVMRCHKILSHICSTFGGDVSLWKSNLDMLMNNLIKCFETIGNHQVGKELNDIDDIIKKTKKNSENLQQMFDKYVNKTNAPKNFKKLIELVLR